jgi:phosphatidylglycerophosphate synthase
VKKLREFRDGYFRILKGPELEEIPDLVFFRPLAYLGVRLVAPTRVSANQVTISSIFLGLLAGWLISQGNRSPALLLWGAGAVLLANVLDCMDGMLARLRGTSSPFGYILDGFGDYIGVFAIMFGIGHLVASRHGQPLEWWAITAAAGVSLAWWAAVVDGMRVEWMRIVNGHRRERVAELAALVDEAEAWKREGTHRVNRMLVACYVLYVRLWGLGTPAAGGAVVDRDPPAEAWAALNRPVLRLALLGGPTVQLTFIILAAAFDRLEWFLWATILWGNAWAAMVLLLRAGARRRMAATAALEEA